MSPLLTTLFVALLAAASGVSGETGARKNATESTEKNQASQAAQGENRPAKQEQGQPAARGKNGQEMGSAQRSRQHEKEEAARAAGNQAEQDTTKSNAAGAIVPRDTTAAGARGMIMECPRFGVNCPPEAVREESSGESSDESVTTTDALPLGSTVERERDGSKDAVKEPSYPISPGAGTAR